MVKHSAVPKEMHQAVLKARPFDCEEEAIDAILHHRIQPGDAVLIRYEGPKGSGMPEMFYTTEAISSDPELSASIALITDGRFSGASKDRPSAMCPPRPRRAGPSPWWRRATSSSWTFPAGCCASGGLHGQEATEEEITAELARRKECWHPRPPKYTTGALGLFTKNAVSPMKGGYMD